MTNKLIVIDLKTLEELNEPKYIPSLGDRDKHQPTDAQVIMQTIDREHYNSRCPGKINDYTFDRGWEFGLGLGLRYLKVVLSDIKSVGVEI